MVAHLKKSLERRGKDLALDSHEVSEGKAVRMSEWTRVTGVGDGQKGSAVAELPRQSGLEKASSKAGENHEGTGEEINTPGCNSKEIRGNTQ